MYAAAKRKGEKALPAEANWLIRNEYERRETSRTAMWYTGLKIQVVSSACQYKKKEPRKEIWGGGGVTPAGDSKLAVANDGGWLGKTRVNCFKPGHIARVGS